MKSQKLLHNFEVFITSDEEIIAFYSLLSQHNEQ